METDPETAGFWATADELFRDLDYADLPRSLDPVATEAEERLGEEATRLASNAAWLLTRWGTPESAVVAGYRNVLDGSPGTDTVRVAAWAARLHGDSFDVDDWMQLAGLGELEHPRPRSLHAALRGM